LSGTINYSLLFGGGAASAGTNLLDAIYGIGASGSAADANPLQTLTTAENDQTQDIATTAKQPAVQRTIAAFDAALSTATTPAALLQNPAVLNVLLTANGLADQIPYTALAQKALLSNPADSNSLVNQLTDTRWAPVVKLYNFATQGLTVLQNPKVQATLANAYAEVTWRQSLDATTPGLSNAMTFRSEASTITSVDQILGDPIMRTVVTTALNIPEQIAFQDLTAQEKSISDRVDITKFQDPNFVDTFTQQYLIAAQAAAATAPSGASLDSLAIQAQGLVV
jgi:hypothetical protein